MGKRFRQKVQHFMILHNKNEVDKGIQTSENRSLWMSNYVHTINSRLRGKVIEDWDGITFG